MSNYYGQALRRWYKFDRSEVKRANGVVDDNVILSLLVGKTASAMRLETGIVKVHVGDESVDAHPAINRCYQKWAASMGNDLFGEVARQGGVLVRWVPVDARGDSAASGTMRQYSKVLREVFQTVAHPDSNVSGGTRKNITSILHDLEADNQIAPELEPQVVPLKAVDLYCRFEQGQPVEFRARWLNDMMASIPTDGILVVQSSPGLEKIDYFFMKGSINMPNDIGASTVDDSMPLTFNSIATVAFPSVAALEALKHLFVKVVAGRSRSTAVAQSRETGATFRNSTFGDVTEAELAAATEHVHVNRAEDHVRRQHGVTQALELDEQEYQNARVELQHISNNSSVPRILRRDPYLMLGASDLSMRSRIIVFPSGDQVAAMPLAEPTPEVITMMNYLRDEIALACGTSMQWLTGERTSNTATGVRDEQQNFREHVGKYRTFMSTIFERMFERAFVRHISNMKIGVAGAIDAATQRNGNKRVKREHDDGSAGAEPESTERDGTRPVNDEILSAVKASLRILVAFSQHIDLDLGTLRELRMADVIGHDLFVRSALNAYNLPREHYDDFVGRQELLREQAKRAIAKRAKEEQGMESYLRSVASGDSSAVPPSNRMESVFDMQNERRVNTDDSNKHLAYFPDPAAFVAANPADLKVLFETPTNAPLSRPSGVEPAVAGIQNVHAAEQAAAAKPGV